MCIFVDEYFQLKPYLSSPRGESSPGDCDVPRQAVLLSGRERLLDPAEFRNDLVT